MFEIARGSNWWPLVTRYLLIGRSIPGALTPPSGSTRSPAMILVSLKSRLLVASLQVTAKLSL